MRAHPAQTTAVLPLILGIASCGCALAGIAAWTGYARNAGASIQAVFSRTPPEAHHFAVLAGWHGLALMLLGLLAVGLALYVRAGKGISLEAKWASGVGLVLGAVTLLLTLHLV
jgi:hypothetical protein